MKKPVHFNVDKFVQPYLKGVLYPFSLSMESLSSILSPSEIEVISIKSQSHITEKLLRMLPALKCIVTRTAGTDHVDLKACKDAGIVVKNIPDYGASNIAEHAFALMLSASRHIPQADRATHEGLFDYEPFMGIGLKGKVLGVLGTGRIGLELIKMVQTFGMKVIAYDVFKNEKAAQDLGFNYVPLGEVLENSDFISVHVPLLPDTRHLLNGSNLKLVKKGAILINTSRGAVVDTDGIIANMDRFGGVALDVVEGEETFSKSHPLLAYDRVIITPHIGFFTDLSVKTIGEETNRIIDDFYQNKL